jgi:hypothetical protein
MKEHYCSICNKSTYDVDYEYLIGFDHLACHLSNFKYKSQVEKVSPMKIKGWEKIHGFTYKGYTIVNPIHNAGETKYMADVLNLNLPQKPKCKLTVIADTPAFKLGYDEFNIILLDLESNNKVSISANKDMMSSLKGFRTLFEDMVDKLVALNDKIFSTIVMPASHSFSGSGIINTVMNGGTTIDYTKVVAQLIDAIKESDELSEKFKDVIVELETQK